MSPSIRRAGPADASLLAEVGAITFSDTFAPTNTTADIQAYVASNFRVDIQAQDLSDPRVIQFIAEIDGNPAGYAKLVEGSTPACVLGETPIELARIYVLQSRQGTGTGAALMNACVEAARESGKKTIWLGVWERNIHAIAFYRRFGFEECGEHVFQLGSDAQRDLIMARSLA